MATVTIKVRLYDLLERVVDEGVQRGFRLAYKHSDRVPDEGEQGLVTSRIYEEVMQGLTEVLDFGDAHEDC